MSKDIDELYNELMSVDPKSAENIHKNNKKRVVRALELYYLGTSKTQQNINSKKIETPYDTLYFFINYKDRQVLYDRINRRVDLMLDAGLVDEAKQNIAKATGTCAQAIGHKELIPYFCGKASLDVCIDNLKKETRHYAKRQITWFKRRENTIILEPDTLGQEGMKNYAISVCEDFINGNFQQGKGE
jgi:tRNA dimethylallyltransferase